MSIYEGTIGEREYAHGRDEGRAFADHIAERGLSFLRHSQERDGRELARNAHSERTRAYWLGWLRGFREVSR